MQVRLSQLWIQARPNFCCGLFGLSMRFKKQGAPDSLGEAPRHVVVVTRVAAEVCLLVNQPDGFGEHP